MKFHSLTRAPWALLLLGGGAHGQACDFRPVELPLRSVQVEADIEGSFMVGIPVQIGTPPQSIVMLPWPELNNTVIYDQQDFCDKTIIFSDTICKVRRGHLFSDTASESFVEAESIVAAGGAGQEPGGKGAEFGIRQLVGTSLGGTETLTIAGNQTIDNFPIAIPRQKWDAGYTYLHSLGLGRNSTILNSLVESRQIAARVWSLSWGRMWLPHDVIDGSLVLGGYDEQKVIGRNYTAPLDYSESSGCWTGMKVQIVDIKVNHRSGKEESIIPRSTAFSVCLVPQRQLLAEIPAAYVDNFERVTNINHTNTSYGLHWNARKFNASKVFDGDLTISFSSGLSVRIPNDQYITPFVSVDRNGSRIFDNTTRELLVNGVGSQPTTLGRYFFTSAYLMVNHDAGTFTLWQANTTSASNLVNVVADADAASRCANESGVMPPAANPPPGKSRDETSPGTEKKGRPAGAIAGGVVAGVAALGGLGFLSWFLWRKRQRWQHENSVQAAPPRGFGAARQEINFAAQDPRSFFPAQELGGSQPTIYEMYPSRGPVYEVDGGACRK